MNTKALNPIGSNGLSAAEAYARCLLRDLMEREA